MRETVSLAGRWRFRLDPAEQGQQQAWFGSVLREQVVLPGTTDENRKGERNPKRSTAQLSRVYEYIGKAWYQRTIEIPESWRGRQIALFLERSKQTQVWVDRSPAGNDASLCATHQYDLTPWLTPGRHTLTICVDNRDLFNLTGSPHAIGEHTQGNWNGIIGRIELVACAPVWLQQVSVYPDAQQRRIRVRVALANQTGAVADGTLHLQVRSRTSHPRAMGGVVEASFECTGAMHELALSCHLGAQAQTWDEFAPVLYDLDVELNSAAGRDRRTVTFGLRDFTTNGRQFVVNGRVTFLRGKHDACVFPLTGYAPMDVADWLRVLKIAQSYGINHYRCHTWCPPEAAFVAADQLGMYLQPELPNMWVGYDESPRTDFLRAEGFRILDAYGNHPSFAMFTLANEVGGSTEIMSDMIRQYRAHDPRHLYAQGSNNNCWAPRFTTGDDFWPTMATNGIWNGRVRYGALVRGSSDQHTRGHVNNASPSTRTDYRDAQAPAPVPVIGHEIGQYCVYPNFREIPKYKGVLKARNFEVFRERLQARGMLDQADDFVRASGALSVICYREEVEAALRTPGFGGFQMLDLQDFPGQGTAIVGLLDAFMDSKGLITPEAWQQFCNCTVPLLLMEKYVWQTNETFTADVRLAHYGPRPLKNLRVTWTLCDQRNKKLAAGVLRAGKIAQGTLSDLGRIECSLAGIAAPQKLMLELRVADTRFRNSYPLWLYAPMVDTAPATEVLLTRQLDDKTREVLKRGGRVLLLPELATLGNSLPPAFQPDFWCYPMFKGENPPGTLGILCDPQHPALADFPTEFHGNWQWWHLVKNGRPVILNHTPAAYRPIVQVIDNFERNQKLGLIFEARVGAGKLLVCTLDLLGVQHRPEARQLLHSLLAYVNSRRFQPAAAFGGQKLAELLFR